MDTCGFCFQLPACMRVERSSGEVLRLCQRCGYFHQVMSQVAVLEQAMPAPPCFLCGKLSRVSAETRDRQGELLGRVRLCEGCVEREQFGLADLLRIANPWTPGVLELPPPSKRVFPAGPGLQPPGLN